MSKKSRLKCEDSAGGADAASELQRVRSNVGSDIQNKGVGRTHRRIAFVVDRSYTRIKMAKSIPSFRSRFHTIPSRVTITLSLPAPIAARAVRTMRDIADAMFILVLVVNIEQDRLAQASSRSRRKLAEYRS